MAKTFSMNIEKERINKAFENLRAYYALEGKSMTSVLKTWILKDDKRVRRLK